MKKLYISLFIFSVAVISALGQAKISGTINSVSVEAATVIKGSNPSPMAIDTLWPAVINSPCYTGDATPWTYYFLLAPNTGYLTGNCQIQTTFNSEEIGQRYSISGTGTISEVLAWYGYTNGTSGTTTAKIYSVNATTKKPQTALGTSATVSVGSIVPTTSFTSYTFTPTVNVTTDFAVSIVLPTNGDSVAIYSTKIGCNTIDSSGYIKLSLAGWYQYNLLLNAAAPNDTALDVAILPVVDVAVGTNEYPSSNGLTLMGAYPNPAKDFTNISYTIMEQATVSVNVFDLTGRVILNSSQPLSAGTHNIKVSLKDIPAGNYYYTITTGDARLTSKFVVAK